MRKLYSSLTSRHLGQKVIAVHVFLSATVFLYTHRANELCNFSCRGSNNCKCYFIFVQYFHFKYQIHTYVHKNKAQVDKEMTGI